MSDAFITIATFETPMEAQLAQNRLEAEGIGAFLSDDETVGSLWHLGSTMGGVKVRVAMADERRARSILARRAKWPDAPARDDYGHEASPGAAIVRARPFDEARDEEDELPESHADVIARRAWRSAIIGLLFCPPLLHFYSLGLLLQLCWAEDHLSEAGKRGVFGAMAINVVGFGAGALLWSGLLRGAF
jgi:hypothetical protein